MDSVCKYFQLFSINQPPYMVHRIAGRRIRDAASRHFRGKLLEIGCGSKTKNLLVGDLVDEHIGLDHQDTHHDRSKVDLFGTAYDIPAKNSSFDCILSTAVLEHLEEPALALREAYRVLKPGGYAIYTAPLFWHLHEEPRDFYRYTRHGLTHLFEAAGFRIECLEPLSGFWTTFLSELSYFLQTVRKGPLIPLVDLVVIANNLVAPLLDRGRFRDERFTWMYMVIVEKPVSDIL